MPSLIINGGSDVIFTTALAPKGWATFSCDSPFSFTGTTPNAIPLTRHTYSQIGVPPTINNFNIALPVGTWRIHTQALFSLDTTMISPISFRTYFIRNDNVESPSVYSYLMSGSFNAGNVTVNSLNILSSDGSIIIAPLTSIVGGDTTQTLNLNAFLVFVEMLDA